MDVHISKHMKINWLIPTSLYAENSRSNRNNFKYKTSNISETSLKQLHKQNNIICTYFCLE